jgi:steroid delta-isomerase-like uncharacterized protein
MMVMLKTNNIKLIKRYFDEVWNNGRLDVLDEIIASDYINHSPGMPNPIPGPDGLKPIVAAIRKAFPDLKYVIENMVVTEDQVAVQTTMHGTHAGDFFGIAPTQKVIKVGQMQIERLADNKIVEHWRITDELNLLKQLGQIG